MEDDLGVYRITAKHDTIPGNWYYGFRCNQCQQLFAAIDDSAAGTTDVQFQGADTFDVTCPRCGKEQLLGPADVQRFQAPPV